MGVTRMTTPKLYRKPTLDMLDLSLGKRTRLHRLLYEHGPGNGKMLVLPIDQGLEHGPRDFFTNPDCKSFYYQLEMAKQCGFSGIACQVGMARKYFRDYAGEVPLILKINGRTEVPSNDNALSCLNASVEDAVHLGADAIGYTLYVGSTLQVEDINTFGQIREDAERYGMPIIVWAYPRGSAVIAKGGQESFWAIDYAARVADELGADIVKVNMPQINPEKDKLAPEPYKTMTVDTEQAMKQIVETAGNTMVIISGGSKRDDDTLLKEVDMCMRVGATGLIFGRNMWQRPIESVKVLTDKIRDIFKNY